MEMSDDEDGPSVKKKTKTEFSQELTDQYVESEFLKFLFSVVLSSY